MDREEGAKRGELTHFFELKAGISSQLVSLILRMCSARYEEEKGIYTKRFLRICNLQNNKLAPCFSWAMDLEEGMERNVAYAGTFISLFSFSLKAEATSFQGSWSFSVSLRRRLSSVVRSTAARISGSRA